MEAQRQLVSASSYETPPTTPRVRADEAQNERFQTPKRCPTRCETPRRRPSFKEKASADTGGREATAADAPSQKRRLRSLTPVREIKMPSAPPGTPATLTMTQMAFPSPPAAPRARRGPALLQALQRRSVKAVRQCLQDDPQAAEQSFIETGWEPPVCCALRKCCGPEIIDLLLQHGASVSQTDVNGRTPLQILCSTPTEEWIRASGVLPVPTAAVPTPLYNGPWQIPILANDPEAVKAFAFPGWPQKQPKLQFPSAACEKAKADVLAIAEQLVCAHSGWQSCRMQLALAAESAGNNHLVKYLADLV